MKIKRIFADFIDYIIVIASSVALFSSPLFANDAVRYTETNAAYMDYVLNAGSEELDEAQLKDLNYEVCLASANLLIIRIAFLFFYFGVLSYFLKGQTIGKKLFDIQVVPVKGRELHPGRFLLRSILQTNLIPEIISLITLVTLSKQAWIRINGYVSNLSSILLFVLVGFMIFREDERGLHDIVGNTKVERKEKK